MRDGLLDVEEIREARRHIEGRVYRTPTMGSTLIGRLCGTQVAFKAELFQKTGSFKIRGVLNKLRSLSADALERGLVSMSAGNHAAALSYGASVFGAASTIVMPSRAILSKIEATRDYGGEVVLTDRDLMEVVGELQEERGLTLVHPFDDPLIMAGHGTIGLEILEDVPDVEAVVVPIGGGGLIGGVATAIKTIRPQVRVIGVEPTAADAMTRALAMGSPVAIGHPHTVADGLAAPFAGEQTLRHAQRFVDQVVRVEDDAIVEALKLIMTRAKLAAEPSGAAPLAAILSGAADLGGAKRVVCVVSGGNIDSVTLKAIL